MDALKNTEVEAVRSGILLIILGLALAAFGGSLMKLATESLSPFIVGWFRFSGYFIILLPIALFRVGRSAFTPPRMGVQIIRGLLMSAGTLLFMFGVAGLDYADAIAILYVYPFLMTLLAPALLGERVSATAWLGVFGGFIGVLLVVRPGFESINIHAVFVIGTGLMVALQMLVNRKLGVLADPTVISTWGAMVAALVLLPAVPVFWAAIEPNVIWVLIAIPFTTAASQTMMILAMARAEASILAPFTYSEIIAAIVIGLIMFGTIPDALSWLGIGLITLCGILVARAKAVEAQRRQPKI